MLTHPPIHTLTHEHNHGKRTVAHILFYVHIFNYLYGNKKCGWEDALGVVVIAVVFQHDATEAYNKYKIFLIFSGIFTNI